MIASPGRSPRPARPATCVSNWNVRSADRKSARPRPTSAEITPTSVHVGKIVPLGDHLRADQDVDFAARDLLERLDEAALPANRVAIDAGDARRGKCLRNFGFDPLGAEADALHVRRRALLARLRHRLR